jgi:hypothetical protein
MKKSGAAGANRSVYGLGKSSLSIAMGTSHRGASVSRESDFNLKYPMFSASVSQGFSVVWNDV